MMLESALSLRITTDAVDQPMDKDAEAKLDQKLFDSIEKFGWFVMNVGVAEGETGPPWTYSFGFQKTLNQPEVIITGLNRGVSHHMIGRIYDALNAGQTLEDDGEWPELLEGYTCISRKVHSSNLVRDWFGYGLWYWQQHLKRPEPYEVYQVLWPGVEDHLMPWADAAHERVKKAQPRLDLPADAVE